MPLQVGYLEQFWVIALGGSYSGTFPCNTRFQAITRKFSQSCVAKNFVAFNPFNSVASLYMTAQPKLLEQVRNVIRRKHYWYETEKSEINWIKRFIAFHNMTPPRSIPAPKVETFLTHLAKMAEKTA
ncbi:MAG: hypothetical protein HC895_15855 [Leptolyngbyaceae cyanobacterium SM1_3_5]|nr:hypothetical protein [Leptolyngbyaceae cyanobacterium SM1_3_5]